MGIDVDVVDPVLATTERMLYIPVPDESPRFRIHTGMEQGTQKNGVFYRVTSLLQIIER